MPNPEHVEIIKKGKHELAEWRRKFVDERLNLSHANLSGVYLYRDDLRGADLNGADLSNSSLHCVDLMYANLVGAILKNAHLDTSDLSEVDLRGADLRGADLGGVRFHNTLLSGTNFEKAYFDWTIVAYCDLSEAIGLEKIIHRGPSSIGLDTILKSKGRIRKCF